IFRPWARHLARLGVRLYQGVQIRDFQLDNTLVRAVSTERLLAAANFGPTKKGWMETLPSGEPAFLCWDPATRTLKALSGRCTHAGQALKARGDHGLDHLYCPLHGGQFNTDGTVLRAPPTTPLRALTTE